MPSVSLKQSDGNISSRSGIIDSRTVLILAPKDDIVTLFSGAPDACRFSCSLRIIDLTLADPTHSDFDLSTGLVIDCESKFRLSITIGKNIYTLEGADLVFAPMTGEDATVCGAKSCCLSTVQAATSDLQLSPTQWILGGALCYDFAM